MVQWKRKLKREAHLGGNDCKLIEIIAIEYTSNTKQAIFNILCCISVSFFLHVVDQRCVFYEYLTSSVELFGKIHETLGANKPTGNPHHVQAKQDVPFVSGDEKNHHAFGSSDID